MNANEHKRTGDTSKSLIRLARDGSDDAWRRMSHLYTPLVYGWVRAAGLGENDAADVVQEVFRVVFGALGRFRHDRPEDTFRGWLLTITRNELRGWFRRQAQVVASGTGGSTARLRLEQLVDTDDEDSAMDVVEDAAGECALIRRAMELIEGDFQPHTWQAFWQTALEGRSAAEVAEQLSMSKGAVRQARFRVQARLREVLEEFSRNGKRFMTG